MKTWVAVLAIPVFFAASAPLSGAGAAPRSAPDYYEQPRARQNPGGSWQCYPYCDGGTYKGRPVREWLKPDRW